MSTKYLGIVHKDPDSDYGISFPDLPGCFSAGSTKAELMRMAKEAVAFHIEGLRTDGEPIPAPTTCKGVDLDGGTLMAVPYSAESTKVARVNITVPAHGLARIDAAASAASMSRSAFLTQAALASVGISVAPAKRGRRAS